MTRLKTLALGNMAFGLYSQNPRVQRVRLSAEEAKPWLASVTARGMPAGSTGQRLCLVLFSHAPGLQFFLNCNPGIVSSPLTDHGSDVLGTVSAPQQIPKKYSACVSPRTEMNPVCL